jgi:hypothetical protein
MTKLAMKFYTPILFVGYCMMLPVLTLLATNDTGKGLEGIGHGFTDALACHFSAGTERKK